MKLLPYSQIKTNHLSLLLFTARSFAILGLLFFIVTAMIFMSSNQSLGFMYSGTFYGFLIKGVLISFGLLALSGVLASLVSFEYHYTKEKH